ncbi:LysE family translocator, partial [Vibrio sp. 10N.222.54.F6]
MWLFSFVFLVRLFIVITTSFQPRFISSPIKKQEPLNKNKSIGNNMDSALLWAFIPTFFFVSITPGMCMTLALTLGMSIG